MIGRNEGDWDRAVRLFVGITLLYAGLDGYLTGAPRIGVAIVGAVALITGLIGYCPGYTAFGISTTKRRVQ